MIKIKLQQFKLQMYHGYHEGLANRYPLSYLCNNKINKYENREQFWIKSFFYYPLVNVKLKIIKIFYFHYSHIDIILYVVSTLSRLEMFGNEKIMSNICKIDDLFIIIC